jgi:hypothetical protein
MDQNSTGDIDEQLLYSIRHVFRRIFRKLGERMVIKISRIFYYFFFTNMTNLSEIQDFTDMSMGSESAESLENANVGLEIHEIPENKR